MQNAQEILKDLEETMRLYRLNKTKIPPEDLNGKYRKSYQRLKEKLKGETEAYLTAYCLSGFRVREDWDELVESVNRSIQENQVGKRVALAVFQDFDLGKVKRIAEEQRQRVMGIYKTYFDRHTCLYAAGSSWNLNNPQPPLIYNDIVDKFYDWAAGEWVSREKPPGDAILIFIKGDKPKEGGGED